MDYNLLFILLDGYMRWLLTYGRLFYRFVFANHLTQEFSYLIRVLHILQETAWLVFLLEHCMSLLMVSDKSTLHLVILILEGLKTILQSAPCTDFTTDEAKAMIKLIKLNMFKLSEGCLSIGKPEYQEYKDYCYIAT